MSKLIEAFSLFIGFTFVMIVRANLDPSAFYLIVAQMCLGIHF